MATTTNPNTPSDINGSIKATGIKPPEAIAKNMQGVVMINVRKMIHLKII